MAVGEAPMVKNGIGVAQMKKGDPEAAARVKARARIGKHKIGNGTAIGESGGHEKTSRQCVRNRSNKVRERGIHRPGHIALEINNHQFVSRHEALVRRELRRIGVQKVRAVRRTAIKDR